MSETNTSNNQKRGRMVADPNDPWIGVHTLTEFIFCPRAGLIQHEVQGDDEDEDHPQLVNSNHLPEYDLPRIEERIKENLQSIADYHARKLLHLCISFVISLLIFSLILWLGGGLMLGVVLAAAFFFFMIIFCYGEPNNAFVTIKTLKRRRDQALNAVPREPDQDLQKEQPVNWWELLKSGFESISYRSSQDDRGTLRDEKWKLAGRPWRVLRRGDLRIPVFLMRRGNSLYPQHSARMAAYCHLLERCEGGKSPYGVILYTTYLFRKTEIYDGIAIPNAPSTRKRFHNALLEARRIITTESQSNSKQSMPKHTAACLSCPYGKPILYQQGKTDTQLNGVKLPAFLATDDDQMDYHSVCGDRFRWLPPHRRAKDKGLKLQAPKLG